jgi:hypothetical protein
MDATATATAMAAMETAVEQATKEEGGMSTGERMTQGWSRLPRAKELAASFLQQLEAEGYEGYAIVGIPNHDENEPHDVFSFKSFGARDYGFELTDDDDGQPLIDLFDIAGIPYPEMVVPEIAKEAA